jgi:hypothetical protein
MMSAEDGRQADLKTYLLIKLRVLLGRSWGGHHALSDKEIKELGTAATATRKRNASKERKKVMDDVMRTRCKAS